MNASRRQTLRWAAALPAAALQRPARAQAPARTLELWTMQLSPALDDYMAALIADFERRHAGVRVKWVDLPWAETERKLLGAIAARTAPDVVNLNPQFSAKLAEFGALADPEQFLDAANRADYLPAAWEANRWVGRSSSPCFALPWYLSANLTIFNHRLLDAAGVTVPASHAELAAVAGPIRQRGQYAYFAALDGSTPLETLVAMGAPLLSDDGCRAGFINPAGDAVLAFYDRLYRQGLTPRNVVTEGHRKGVEMFIAGEVAMLSSGMQFLQSIQLGNPGLFADVAVAPPLRSPGTPPGIAAMNLVVPRSSRQPDLAFALARHVSSPAQQLALAKRVPILPSTLASYREPLFAQADPATLLGRARRLSAQAVLAGKVLVPPLRGYSKLRSSFALHLAATMLGKQTRAEALADIDRQWAAVLRCSA